MIKGTILLTLTKWNLPVDYLGLELQRLLKVKEDLS